MNIGSCSVSLRKRSFASDYELKDLCLISKGRRLPTSAESFFYAEGELLLPLTEGESLHHFARKHVVDGDVQLTVLNFAFDDSWIFAPLCDIRIRSSSYDLRARTRGSGFVVAILVLMGRDDELAVSLLEQGSPQLSTGPLPHGIVGAVLRIGVGRTNVDWVALGIGLEERYMAACHQIRGFGY